MAWWNESIKIYQETIKFRGKSQNRVESFTAVKQVSNFVIKLKSEMRWGVWYYLTLKKSKKRNNSTALETQKVLKFEIYLLIM